MMTANMTTIYMALGLGDGAIANHFHQPSGFCLV